MRVISISLILILCLVSAKNFEPNSTCSPEISVGRDPFSVSHYFRFRSHQRLICPYASRKWSCEQCTFEAFYRNMFEFKRSLMELQVSSNSSTSSPEMLVYLGYFEFLLETLLKYQRCCFEGDKHRHLTRCQDFRPHSFELREYFAGINSGEIKDIIKVIEGILNTLKPVYAVRKDIKCFNAELLVSSLITQPLWNESNTWREILIIGSIIRRFLRGECIEILKKEKLFMEDTFLQYGNDCQYLNIDRGFTEILTDLQMNRERKHAESRNQTAVCSAVDITSNLQKNVCPAGNMTSFEDIIHGTFQYAYLKFSESETSKVEDSLTDAVHLKYREANVFKCWTSHDLMLLFDINPKRNINRDDFRRLCPALIQQRLSTACMSNENMNSKGSMNAENLASTVAKSTVSDLYSCLSVFLLSAGSFVNAFVFKKVKAANYQQWISVLFALSFATMTGQVASHIVPLFSGFDDAQDLKEFSWSIVFPESMLLQLTCTVVISALLIFRSYIICKGIEKNVEFSRHEELCEVVSRRQRMFSSEPDWRSEISLDFPNESTECEFVSRRQGMFSFDPAWESEVSLGYPCSNTEHDILEPVLNEVKQEPLYFVNYVPTDEEIPTTADTLPGTSIETSSPEMKINSEGAGSVPEISITDYASGPGTSMETSSTEMIVNSEGSGSVPEISAADFSSAPATSIETLSAEMIMHSEGAGSAPEISIADFSSVNETIDRVTVRRRVGSATVSSTEAVDANQEKPQSSIKRRLARCIPEINPNVVEIFVADFIHNLADGMMINLLFTHSLGAGVWGIIAIALHEFSHEAANILKLQSMKLTFKKLLWINAVSAISSTLGVILSMFLQDAWRKGSQAITYGLFVDVIMNHLIPELRMSLKNKYDRKLFVKKILAICCGIAVMTIIRLIELKYGQL